jgi:glutamate-1-semialdehyde 2,1-aminomutase
MGRASQVPGQQTDAYAASREHFERAQASLAGGVSTAFRAFEKPHPLFFREASGAKLVDVDGNEYVDFVCGFGPILLGHGHPGVVDAVCRAAGQLQQVGGQHVGEVELAERLCGLVPAFETMRFSMTGSEAVHGALRLARAATGRNLVVKFTGHFHGWLDGVFHSSGPTFPGLPDSPGIAAGARGDLVVLEWGDADALAELFDRAGPSIAAVIMEPLPCNQGVFYPPAGYLEAARKLTADAGAVLVFDEVITGFRVGLGGAQERFGVTPDLAVVAKAMANGFPVSAFGGRRELMATVATNKAVHAGTYNGGGISIAAGLATLDALEGDPGLYERMERLGARLMDGLKNAAQGHGLSLQARGPGPVFFTWFTDGEVSSVRDHFRADTQSHARFAELMLAEGVRIIPAGRWYLTAAHGDAEIDRAVEAADRAFAQLAA